jgi:hypothetical protein
MTVPMVVNNAMLRGDSSIYFKYPKIMYVHDVRKFIMDNERLSKDLKYFSTLMNSKKSFMYTKNEQINA